MIFIVKNELIIVMEIICMETTHCYFAGALRVPLVLRAKIN